MYTLALALQHNGLADYETENEYACERRALLRYLETVSAEDRKHTKTEVIIRSSDSDRRWLMELS